MKSCGGRCPNCWKSCRRWWKCKITGRGNIPLPVILHLNRYYFLLFSVSNPSLNLMQSSHFMLQSCISNRSGFRITPTYGMPRSLQISITSRRHRMHPIPKKDFRNREKLYIEIRRIFSPHR